MAQRPNIPGQELVYALFSIFLSTLFTALPSALFTVAVILLILISWDLSTSNMLLFGWLTDLGNEARLLDSEALLGIVCTIFC
ncbi:hypothetical protein QL285_009006 [Trifolium repens]|nr:hypothetical protein QL285_083198 [Trifolium repens]KAK2449851.1 hypothetical protein QL285_009006 [Trifolium repens]